MTRLHLLAFHSTSAGAARKIARGGFRLPSRVAHAATDGRVGDYFPAIFFSRLPPDPGFTYGDALLEAEIDGFFVRWRSRRGESASDTLHRLLEEARRVGAAGVDSGTETIGIAVVDPGSILRYEIVRRGRA